MLGNAHPNRTALVTGAGSSRGIGAATAIRLGCNGLAVAMADLVPPVEAARKVLDGLEDTASRVQEASDRAIVVPLDVTDPEQMDAATSGTVHTFGGLDVLVNNTGAGLRFSLRSPTRPIRIPRSSRQHPHNQAIRRGKPGVSEDPDMRAMTWRAFQRKLHIGLAAG
jgi:NAD(P)-dependent dehydrogenase (short-subunit alcohol dehydrogenase family)